MIIKIILIIIIIILLLHNCCLIEKSNTSNKNDFPTGNVDIFEIKIDNASCRECESDKKGYNKDFNNYNAQNSNKNQDNETQVSKNDLEINDKNIIWSTKTTLGIFSNSAFNMEQIIAPESSNTYHYIVSNNTKYNVLYDMEFFEDNPYSINMKYKLKLDNKYIVGDKNNWVSYEKLNKTKIYLSKSSKHNYYLEWKWISSENDYNVGNEKGANYSLKIDIEAVQTNE